MTGVIQHADPINQTTKPTRKIRMIVETFRETIMRINSYRRHLSSCCTPVIYVTHATQNSTLEDDGFYNPSRSPGFSDVTGG